MRIGLLTTSFPRHEGDSAGSFVLGFAQALASRGHALEVLAPEPEAPCSPPQFEGVDLTWLPYLRPRSLQRTFYGAGVPDNVRREPSAALGLLPFAAQLLRAARSRAARWDAVVSHWALPSALVASLLMPRPRHLAVLHSADVFALESLPAGSLLARRVIRHSEQLLCVSRDLRRRLLALLPEADRQRALARVHVSPMGIAPGPTPPAAGARHRLRQQLGLSAGPVLLSMGRLVPIKGVDRLIDATRRVPDVTLVIAGDGPQRHDLEALAHGSNRVRFVGHLQGADKTRWLQAADAFALPSRIATSGRREGTPTALLEAMDAGLPVLASATGGVPDVVRDGVEGRLVDDGPDAWPQALASLQDGPRWRAMGRRARRRAREFHWDAVIEGVENLLTGPPG